MAVSMEIIDGAEVRVETGKGLIVTADLDEGQSRNRKVEIRATHTNLQELVGGWLDSHNNRLFTAVQEAVQANAEVEYVIHVRRKADVAASVPFSELKSRQKIRDLIKIAPASGYRRDDEPGPVQEPRSEALPAQEARTAPAAASAPAPAQSVRRGLRVEEARPWERRNSDGSINVGSYEVQATYGMATLAYKLLLEKARADAARGEQMIAPRPAQVRTLGKLLLTAADAVQASIRADGMADRMDTSHSRARGAIREALDAYPVPWGATDQARAEWWATLTETATMLLGIGLELIEVPLGEPPKVSAPTPATDPSPPPARAPEPIVPTSSAEADAAMDAEERGEDPVAAIKELRSRLDGAKSAAAVRREAAIAEASQEVAARAEQEAFTTA